MCVWRGEVEAGGVTSGDIGKDFSPQCLGAIFKDLLKRMLQ